MRRLGLIGGMSWESSAVYYRLINQGVRARRGGLSSAELLLYSVDFAPIAEAQAAGAWDQAGAALAEAARRLETAGAEAILLCTNTMHLVADTVREAVSIPLLDIVDLTAVALIARGARRPLLLATSFTMEHGFYQERMRGHGLEILTPSAAGRAETHRIIYEELCQGVVREQSRAALTRLIAGAAERGAETAGAPADAVILGCTELGLILDPNAAPLPGLDTTALHAAAATEWALASAAS